MLHRAQVYTGGLPDARGYARGMPEAMISLTPISTEQNEHRTSSKDAAVVENEAMSRKRCHAKNMKSGDRQPLSVRKRAQPHVNFIKPAQIWFEGAVVTKIPLGEMATGTGAVASRGCTRITETCPPLWK
ncbi:hypothetical protein B0H19DRAFT_1236177 [Mycena capillaripes]|nr:hypothetical protein B0H19DRAFT_1236177 [Mycena capillaripes]